MNVEEWEKFKIEYLQNQLHGLDGFDKDIEKLCGNIDDVWRTVLSLKKIIDNLDRDLNGRIDNLIDRVNDLD